MQFVPVDATAFPADNTDYYYQTLTLEITSLCMAYLNGFFPWYEKGESVRYYHPAQRAILDPTTFHCSHSLRKSIFRAGLSCAVDTNFEQVIAQCAVCHTQRHGATWITDELRHAFCTLHSHGLAHSVEVYAHGALCGGLYGLALGTVFCGESMFHTTTDASKLALLTLCRIAPHHNITLIDCQLPTRHLESLGATAITRANFLKQLRGCLHHPTRVGVWRGGIATAHSVTTEQLLAIVSSEICDNR